MYHFNDKNTKQVIWTYLELGTYRRSNPRKREIRNGTAKWTFSEQQNVI